MIIICKPFLNPSVMHSVCHCISCDLSLFALSGSIRLSVKSLFFFLFLGFPLLVGAVKQKPMRPEGETVRHVILPMTDNNNSRLRIIMFDWALVKETLLWLYLGTHIYSCCQTNPTSAFSSRERNACFLWEFPMYFWNYIVGLWQVLWPHNH